MTELSIGTILNNVTEKIKYQLPNALEIGLILLSRELSRPKTWVLAHKEELITHKVKQSINEKVDRLMHLEPLPYVMNYQEFFKLPFYVSPEVLIPRPETELLVEQAITWLKANPQKKNVIDVGTGSGIISISIANSIPDANIIATDISLKALCIAKKNALLNKVDGRMQFLNTDLFLGIKTKFDLICANLPYIPTDKLSEVNSINFEPQLALDGGISGLKIISKFLLDCRNYYKKEALILTEIEENQGDIIKTNSKQLFPAASISIVKDLAGKDRLLKIQL